MSKLKVGCSPITGVIYAGSVTKTGLWTRNKIEVTDEARRCVAESMLLMNELLRFEYKGNTYELSVKKIK